MLVVVVAEVSFVCILMKCGSKEAVHSRPSPLFSLTLAKKWVAVN